MKSLKTLSLKSLFAGASVLALGAAALFPLPASAGSETPGCWDPARLRPGAETTYRETFFAGEVAVIEAEGDGDIDLFVYDGYGRLVGEDTELDGAPVVRFVPRRTQEYTIVVVNAEGYTVDFHLCSN